MEVSDELLRAAIAEHFGHKPKAQAAAERQAEQDRMQTERKAVKDAIRAAIKRAIDRGLIPGTPGDYGVSVQWGGNAIPTGIRISTRCAPEVTLEDMRDREDIAAEAFKVTDNIERQIVDNFDEWLRERTLHRAFGVHGTAKRG
jgi:hypothetical protein